MKKSQLTQIIKEELLKEASIPDLKSEIIKKLKDLVFDKIKITFTKLSNDGKWLTLPIIKIDPKQTGIVAPMFKSLEVKIEIAMSADAAYISIDYKYKHMYGSNGHEVRFNFSKGKWTQTE